MQLPADMHVFGRGRLASPPRLTTTQRGAPFCTARFVCNLPDKTMGAARDAKEPLWLRLVVMHHEAEFLALHEKGDPVYIAGSLRFSSYPDRATGGLTPL